MADEAKLDRIVEMIREENTGTMPSGPDPCWYGVPIKPPGATKYDNGKPPLSIIPREGLELTAKVFKFGADKYGRDNYRLGMEWSRLVDAAMRHLVAFYDGEDLDPESGLSHLGHALCCLNMLALYEAKKRGTDDRPKDDPGTK